jgi:hypothetical protein
MSSLRLAVAPLVGALLAGVSLQPAQASQLIERTASQVTLAVSPSGQALIGYRAHGAVRHVLAGGSVNAISADRRRRQVAFKLRYFTGRSAGLPHVENACRPYRGPPLHWLVRACTMPDGSHWALQSWRRLLPNFGLPAHGVRGARELRLSHWTGAATLLVVKRDWAYGVYDHLYGWGSFHGAGVFGTRFDPLSSPLDGFGRELYIDTLDSAYGAGWRRENGFPTRGPNGAFCYGFYPHGRHPAGAGRAYRVTLVGPGVAPDAFWQSEAQGDFDPVRDDVANSEQQKLTSGRPFCHIN